MYNVYKYLPTRTKYYVHNNKSIFVLYTYLHGLRTPREEKVFTARPKIQSQSQIFRYGRSIFCLPHRPNFSDIFDLCLHWMSVVRAPNIQSQLLCTNVQKVENDVDSGMIRLQGQIRTLIVIL